MNQQNRDHKCCKQPLVSVLLRIENKSKKIGDLPPKVLLVLSMIADGQWEIKEKGLTLTKKKKYDLGTAAAVKCHL